MATEKRLKRNISKNQILDRELDYLSSTISRDDVREIARRYGPQRRRSVPVRIVAGTTDFFARYSAPFAGMVIGAEYRAAKALYPLIGRETRFGDSLRFFLGESIGKRIDEASKAFEVAGTLVAATPHIVVAALYGAVMGVVAYYVVKVTLMLGASYRRRSKIRRKVAELLR
jgi:hypothetical protein